MRKTVLTLLAAIPVAILACQANADEPQGPGPRGGPGMFFQRLDKNKDGKVTADEVPETAPEFVKDMLKKADKNQDKTITAEELRTAASQLRPDSPNAHFRGPRPEGRPEAGPPSRGRPGPPTADRGPRPEARPEAGPPSRGRSGSPSADRGPRPEGSPEAGPATRGRSGPPSADRGSRPDGRPEAGPPSRGRPGPPSAHRGPSGPGGRPEAGPPSRPGIDPEAVFARLDRDKNGQLSPEEFATGMKALHAGMHGPGRPAMGPPAGRGPKPGAERSARSHSSVGHRGAMNQSRGRAPATSPRARLQGMSRAPMASHGRFPGMKRPPMGPRPGFGGSARGSMGPRSGFGGMHRPSAPWQARSQGMPSFPGGLHGGPHPGMISERLKGADKNKDGKISKTEAPEMLKQNFERVDANKDGQLDRIELARGAAAVRAKFQAGTVDKRREAMAKRIQAVRKAHGHAGRPQPKKPTAEKGAVKKPAARKPAAEKKPAEKKPAAKKRAS